MNPSFKARMRELAKADGQPEATPVEVPKKPVVRAEMEDLTDVSATAPASDPDNQQTPNAEVKDGLPPETVISADATQSAEIEGLKAEVVRLTSEVERLTSSNTYLQNRWNTYAGMHKSQVTSVAHENETLKLENAELKAKLESVPATNQAEAILKKRFGEDVWGRMDEDEQQRWIRTEEAHQLERDALRKTVESNRAPANSDRIERFWKKVESTRPGFKAAMDDDLTGIQIFLDMPNPDSTEGLTYRKCIEIAATTGNIQTVTSIADKFSELDGRKFNGKSDNETTITPHPQSVTPRQTTSAAPSTAAQKAQATAPTKPHFPKGWAIQFQKYAQDADFNQRKGKPFRPVRFKVGEFARDFKTIAEVRRVWDQVNDAELEDRLD